VAQQVSHLRQWDAALDKTKLVLVAQVGPVQVDGPEPLPALPYTEPGSDAQRLSIVGGQFREFARRRLAPAYGPIIGGAIVALATALLLGWALGPWALALSAAALFSPQIALLGRGQSAGLALAAADAGLVELGLPFALGAGLIGAPTAGQIALGAAAAIAWAGLRAGRNAVIWQAGNAAALAVLAARRHTVGSFLFALCWPPQLMGRLGGVSRHARRWALRASGLGPCCHQSKQQRQQSHPACRMHRFLSRHAPRAGAAAAHVWCAGHGHAAQAAPLVV